MIAKLARKLAIKGNTKHMMLIAACGLLVVAGTLAVRMLAGTEEATAHGPPTRRTQAKTVSASNTPAAQPRQPTPQDVVAKVNGRQITRGDLGAECVRHFGKQVLESVLNRYLITLECRKYNISVTNQEIDQEVDRMARRFGLPVDQWLNLLETERNISAEHYRREIIWPTLALRRLSAKQIQVTDDEIVQEFQSRFGPQVQVRMIVVPSREQAERLRQDLLDNPAEFPRLAAKFSTDVNSASAGGLVQPIRLHLGEPVIERAAFSLQEGQLSQVLELGDQYLILKCEKQIPGQKPAESQLKQIEQMITESIRDQKLRVAGAQLFKQLQANAKVQNVFNDPQLSQQMPGVAATLNGSQISLRELEESCIVRHGEEVLEAMVNRFLLEMELAKARQAVTQREVQIEIERAAVAAGFTDEQTGRPDIPQWMKFITEEQEITEDAYLANVVWPSAALKKLVDGQVEVTDEDLQKALEANYGKRVRLRAIVMNNLRRAQEVWDMARRNLTVENFAELASEYSVEPGSKALGGIVPPIQKHSGQPTLEKVAFAMQPGELSGVVQVGERYVILLCEGITEPVVVDMKDVRDELHDDILEKKLRIRMAERFEQIIAAARVTNYLNPEASRTPTAKNGGP
jgi:parvulin-like peptidyl-prolyl isomerase